MNIYLIYRIFRNSNNQIEKIKPIEYCSNDVDAKKYAKLFDLQVPVDLKQKISHKYYSTSLIE